MDMPLAQGVKTTTNGTPAEARTRERFGQNS